MKKRITAIILIICLICMCSSGTLADILQELPDGYTKETLGSGSVTVDGASVILAPGSSAPSLARGITAGFEFTDTLIAFCRFSVTGNTAKNSIGLIQDGNTYELFSVTGTTVTTEEGSCEISDAPHTAMIMLSEGSVSAFIDGERILSTNKPLRITKTSFYINVLAVRAAGGDKTQVSEFKTFADTHFDFQSDISNGDKILKSAFDDVELSFGTPLVKAPEITLEKLDGTSVELNTEFTLTTAVINSADLEYGGEYVIKINKIETAFGTENETAISFTVFPEDYIPVSVSLSGIDKVYRFGQTLSAQVSSSKPENAVKSRLVVNSSVVDEISGVGILYYRFPSHGQYTIYAEIYDGNTWSKSEKHNVSVSENPAPVIESLDIVEGAPVQSDTVRFVITDDDGIDSAEFYQNGVYTADYSVDGDIHTLNVKNVTLGDIVFKVVVHDAFGAESRRVFTASGTKKKYEQIGNITDYDTRDTGMESYMKDIYTSSLGTLYDKNEPEKNSSIAQIFTRPKGAASSGPYICKVVNEKGIFRFSNDVYFVDSVADMTWLVRGTGDDYTEPVKIYSQGVHIDDITYPLDANTWYHTELTVDTVNETFEFAIDGEPLTPSGGLKLPNKLTYPTIHDIRIEFFFGEEQSVGFDNWKLERILTMPYILQVQTESLKKLRITPSESLKTMSGAIKSNPGLFTVSGENSTVNPKSAYYDSATDEIVLEFDKALISAKDYSLCCDASLFDVNNILDGEILQIQKSFKTPTEQFDVTDFAFTLSHGRVGARAVFENCSTSGEQTAIMVLSIYDEKGGTISVRAGKPVTVRAGERKEAAVETSVENGTTAEVIFINSWEDFIAIKSQTEKINLK